MVALFWSTTIMPTKECPLCGESMRLRMSEAAVQVPGNPQPLTQNVREWVCPECDYFEEADADEM
jgi:transposase